MIKYNLQNINDWNFGDDNIIKVYYDNAVCYYKVISSGGTTAQTPCFAVVDDISQYQETEFEDVFNKADNSWYKLNNLSQYEKYGLYGSGLSITTYEGKLTVDNGYEYIYSGGSWVNVGEVSGSTRVPQGYTEYDYVSNNSNAYIDTGLLLYSATSNTFKIESTLFSAIIDSQTYQNIFTCMTEAGEPYQGFVYRFESYRLKPRANPSSDVVFSTVDNGDGTSAVTVTCSTGITYTHDYPLVIGCGLDDSKNPFRFTNTSIYSFKLTLNNSLTLDYIPCKRDSDNVYGVYDAVGNTFITSSNSHPFTGGSPSTASTAVTYPMYYDDKSDPPDNLTFNTMAEALAYECPWVGMTATIDGTAYMFCEGNEWLTKYSYVEVTREYLCDNGNKYKKMQEYDRQADGTLTPTSNYVKGDLIESGSTDCQSRLPQGYTEVEYVYTTGDSYVNLQIDPYSALTNSYTLETRLSSYTQSDFAYLISSEDADSSPYYGVGLRWDSEIFQAFGGSYESDTTVQQIDNGDGTSSFTFNCDSVTHTNNNIPFTLFCGYYGGSGWRFGKASFYSLSLTMNGNLERNLIPCKRDNDDVAGFYDTVYDVFYTALSGTPLTAGQEIG